MFTTNISYFASARATDPTTVTLGAFLNSTRHKATIESLRAEQDEKKRADLKKRLPAATISGTFTQRKAEAIQQYNGLVCLDFDGKDNTAYTPEQMKSLIAEFEEILYAGFSASATGVFAIVPTKNGDIQQHGRVVEIMGHIFEKIGLKYDRSCKDVCRLRFISYDPEPVYNPDAKPFDAKTYLVLSDRRKEGPKYFQAPAQSSAKRPGQKTTMQRIEDYVAAIESGANDITAIYDDWVRIGIALANELGSDGEAYYHRISQFNPKYDHAKTSKKFEELRKNGRSVHIGTFFKIAQDNGINL